MFYTDGFKPSGVTTSRATDESLDSPSYLQPVFTNGSTRDRMVPRDTEAYNAFFSYRLGKSHTRASLRNTSVRAALSNTLAQGRSDSLTLAKKI